MYIVIVQPAPSQINNLGNLNSFNFPTVEYYLTRDLLVARLQKGGNLRVFEAKELNFQLDVKLTEKSPIDDIKYNDLHCR